MVSSSCVLNAVDDVKACMCPRVQSSYYCNLVSHGVMGREIKVFVCKFLVNSHVDGFVIRMSRNASWLSDSVTTVN